MDLNKSIKQWLIEENMFKEELNDSNAEFHFMAEFPKGNMMDIIQPKNKSDLIVIGCATQVSPEHLTLMNSSSNKNNENFLWDVKFSLNQFLVDFDLHMNNGILEQFIITDDIYIDELSKNNFIKLVKKVFKAKINCVWLIEKYYGQVKPQQQFSSNENSMFV